jgi:site-specific recombinase XerD
VPARRAARDRSRQPLVNPAHREQVVGDGPAGLVEDVKLRRAQDVAHSTVDNDLAVLKSFFNSCIARKLGASNLVRRVRFFDEDNSRLRYLIEDEYNRLRQAAEKMTRRRCSRKKITFSPARNSPSTGRAIRKQWSG